MKLGKLSKLVGIVASCLTIPLSGFAERRKVIYPPIYLGSCLTPAQQAQVVEVYNAFKENSEKKQAMLINLSDKVGIEDKFVSKDEKKVIGGEFAQLMIGETEKYFGRDDIDEIDVAMFWGEMIQKSPYLARDELVRFAFDCAFDQTRNKNYRE